MPELDQDKLFWDSAFTDALRLSAARDGIDDGSAKRCAKVADEALKARRKTFKVPNNPVSA